MPSTMTVKQQPWRTMTMTTAKTHRYNYEHSLTSKLALTILMATDNCMHMSYALCSHIPLELTTLQTLHTRHCHGCDQMFKSFWKLVQGFPHQKTTKYGVSCRICSLLWRQHATPIIYGYIFSNWRRYRQCALLIACLTV